MRAHLDLLGRLFVVWGAFGMLGAVSLAVLASGAMLTPGADGARLRLGGIVIAAAAVLPLIGGLLHVWIGRALARRESRGRLGALALAVPNLFLLPFGTALGIYSYWVLLNNHVREIFAGAPGEAR